MLDFSLLSAITIFTWICSFSLLLYFIVSPLLIKWDEHETAKFRREMKNEWGLTDAELDEIISTWTSIR